MRVASRCPDEALKQFIDNRLGARAHFREHPEERYAREILSEGPTEWRCLDHRCCVDSPECNCASLPAPPVCRLCDNPDPHGHYCAESGALVYSAWPMEAAPNPPTQHWTVS